MTPFKALYIGDSGTGKTGSLFSLLKDYTLVIADFDNGLDILRSLIASKAQQTLGLSPRDAAAKLIYRTFNDSTKFDQFGKLAPGSAAPSAYFDFIRSLESIKYRNLLGDEVTLGGISKLDAEHVFVVDSITTLGRCIFKYYMFQNKKFDKVPEWTDYNGPQQMLLQVIERLYADTVPSNLLLLSHITYTNEDLNEKRAAIAKDEPTRAAAEIKGYASTGVGKSLSPALARYFNFLLVADTTGTNKRIIRTQLSNDGPAVTIKCPVFSVPAELPIETGLGTIMTEWRKTQQAFL